MEELEADLKLLLNGEVLADGPLDIQCGGKEAAAVSQRSVAYVVCAVLVDPQGHVLMVQEAKLSSCGMWYLPAGRLQPTESLQEGIKREMLQETGLEFEPTSLLSVEIARGRWFRFCFTGNITGGTLKTLPKKDKISLQAKWIAPEQIREDNPGFPLRAADILPLIDRAVSGGSDVTTERVPLLPAVRGHDKLLLRCVITCQCDDVTNVLYSQQERPHLLQIALQPRTPSLQEPVFALMQEVFSDSVCPYILGLLGIEHAGNHSEVGEVDGENNGADQSNGHDNGHVDSSGQYGVCLTVLMSVSGGEESALPSLKSGYGWHAVQDGVLCDSLKKRAQLDACAPLINL